MTMYCKIDDLNEIIKSNNISVIFVDIDDTLYDYKFAHRKALNECYQNSFLAKGIISFSEFKEKYRYYRDLITNQFKYNGSTRSRILAFQRMFESLGINSAYTHSLDFENKYWSSIIKNIKPNENLIALLKSNKSKGIKICALSDMQMRFQVEKLKKLRLTRTIEFLVTSEEVGVEKPSASLFKYALNKLSITPDKAIMIGDNYDKDIKGAADIGIKTFHHQFIFTSK